MNKVFLDTETTGLNYDTDHVIEVAWAVEDGFVRTLVLPHDVTNAHPKALEINRYYERGLDKASVASAEEIDAFLAEIKGCTLVGANPRFDATMLVNSLGLDEEPWHYRLFDLQSFAAGILGGEVPQGMAKLFDVLTFAGYTVPKPDHSAAGDVEATRVLYNILRDIQGALITDANLFRRLSDAAANFVKAVVEE